MVAWMPDGRSLLVRDRGARGWRPLWDLPDRLRDLQAQSGHAPAERNFGDSAFDVSPTDVGWHSSDTSGRASAMSTSRQLLAVTLAVGPTGIPRSGVSRGRRTGAKSYTPSSKNLASTRPCFGFEPPAIDLERGVRALHVNAERPSMSRPPSGESGRLAFTTARIDVALRLVDLRGPLAGGVFQSVRRFADSTRLDVPGPFSTNGERVAFVSDRNGWARVWVANRDGSGAGAGDDAQGDGARDRTLVTRRSADCHRCGG